MQPSILKPTSVVTLQLSSTQTAQISEVNLFFDKWSGVSISDSYNNKPILDLDGEPVFAEIAILRTFQKEGWNGVWVDTYGRKYRNSYWGENAVVSLPGDKQKLLIDIYEIAGSKSGCWDVFCWKDEEIIFAESKWHLKDSIRSSQIKWLEAALKYGLKEESFLMVEWDFSK